MKVAISATGNHLNADVDNRFGRCPWLLLVDTDSLQCEAIQNTAADAQSGAGTSTAQLVLEKEAEVVISGQVGPNAYEVLKQGGVRIFIASKEMTAEEAVDKFKNNQLEQMEMKVF